MPTLFKPSPRNLWAALVVREPTVLRTSAGVRAGVAWPDLVPIERHVPVTPPPITTDPALAEGGMHAIPKPSPSRDVPEP